MKLPSYLVILSAIITIIRFGSIENMTPNDILIVLVSINFIGISILRLIELRKEETNGKKS